MTAACVANESISQSVSVVHPVQVTFDCRRRNDQFQLECADSWKAFSERLIVIILAGALTDLAHGVVSNTEQQQVS